MFGKLISVIRRTEKGPGEATIDNTEKAKNCLGSKVSGEEGGTVIKGFDGGGLSLDKRGIPFLLKQMKKGWME